MKCCGEVVLACLILLGCRVALRAEEPGRNEGTLLLCDFESLAKADFAKGASELVANGATVLAYRKNRWMHFTLTWACNENRVAARMYVDGYLVTSAISNRDGTLAEPKGPIHLGADLGTTMPKSRWADGTFDAFVVLGRT